jgi:hypothetical protein
MHKFNVDAFKDRHRDSVVCRRKNAGPQMQNSQIETLQHGGEYPRHLARIKRRRLIQV